MNANKFLLSALVLLAGCSSSMTQQQQMNDTREIALLIQSVGVSTAKFQQDRDAIAVASQRQRNALESLARQQESALTTTLADWRIEGATERRQQFDAVREEAGLITAALNRDAERNRAMALEMQKARSAVNFSQSNINTAAARTMQLAEPVTQADQVRFLTDFARRTRAKIVADQNAEASARSARIAANWKGSAP